MEPISLDDVAGVRRPAARRVLTAGCGCATVPCSDRAVVVCSELPSPLLLQMDDAAIQQMMGFGGFDTTKGERRAAATPAGCRRTLAVLDRRPFFVWSAQENTWAATQPATSRRKRSSSDTIGASHGAGGSGEALGRLAGRRGFESSLSYFSHFLLYHFPLATRLQPIHEPPRRL